MHWWVVLTLAVACTPTPARPPVTTRVPAAPAAPTCAEIGIILRGDGDGAGPAREQAIQAACERDRWAEDVIRCAASQVHPTTCLEQLTVQQRTAYDAIVAPPPSAVVDDPGLSCSDALHNADSMSPALDDASPERAWQSEHRQRFLISECERHGWNEVARACLAIATTPDAIDACLTSELDPAKLDVIHKRLDEVARDAKTIAALRKKKVECPDVVTAHYPDKKWQGRGKPEERKASRNALLLACKNEKWDDFRRACMISGRTDCAADFRWDYPAISSACGEYAASVERVSQCMTLPVQTRDAVKHAFDAARLATVPDEACSAAAAAISDVLRSSGC